MSRGGVKIHSWTRIGFELHSMRFDLFPCPIIIGIEVYVPGWLIGIGIDSFSLTIKKDAQQQDNG